MRERGRGTARRSFVLALAAAQVLTLALPAAGRETAAVVNGTPSHAREHPWQVAITDADGNQFCGGSILDATTIVTAAHCLQGERPWRTRVRAGVTWLRSDAGQTMRVASFEIHSRPWVNDVAIIHLREELRFNRRVRPITPADPVEQASLYDDGSPAVTTGWGARSENGSGSNRLLETDLFILGDQQCNDRYNAGLDDDVMLCANHPDGNDSCYGDSGGPLVVVDPLDETPYLVGIVSFGLAACGKKAGVYTEVPAFLEFLGS